MASYKLMNGEKKNVTELEVWRNSETGEQFTIENGWRWGEWFIESDDEPKIDLDAGTGKELGTILGDYDITDQNLDDGCWCDFQFGEGFDEARAEQIEEAWNEDGMEGLENLGFEHWDTETYISGPLLLEKVEDDD